MRCGLLIAIAAHGLLLLGDSYLRPGLAGIALPFVMSNQPVWTGLGIIGGWLAAILGLSFYVRSGSDSDVAVDAPLDAARLRARDGPYARFRHRCPLAVAAAIIGATAVPIVFAGTYRFLPREQVRRPAPVPAPESPGADPYSAPRKRPPMPAPESVGS